MIAVIALVFVILSGEGRAAGRCAPWAGVYAASHDHETTVALVRRVALAEGVDPDALVALGMTETGLRPALGNDCEVGHFQIMPWWAGQFGLPSAAWLWDLEIGATAAARIYGAGVMSWVDRYARAGRSACLVQAGWRAGALDRATYGAVVYNWGRARRAFARVPDARLVDMPDSTCAYAVRFKGELDGAARRRVGA